MTTMDTTESTRRIDAQIAHYELLDAPPGRDLTALVDLLARICEVPLAAINVITSTEQHQIVTSGFDPSVCAREDSMCAVVMDEPRPVVVPDATLDPRFADNPFVTGQIGDVRFYASASLRAGDGTPIGRLCVFDSVPHELTDLQLQALGTLAEQVMDLFELRVRGVELERSLQALTETRDELSRSNEQLTLFAGQVSHDLRSPLTAILANAELLATEPPISADPDLTSMVDAVGDAGQRMATMIDDILSYAREGGHLRLAPTKLGEVFGQAVADLGPTIAQTSASVVVDEMPTVVADAQMLYSVAQNLLTNAVKFARPGEAPQVHVSAEVDGGTCRVLVRDHGIGIPADRRDAMFTLFTRGESSAKGHGVGLATARRIVEAHGGQIGIQGSDHDGTTVWFDLPL